MKVGNLIVFGNGRFVVGPHLGKLAITILLLLLPFAFVLGFGFYAHYAFETLYPAVGVMGAFLLITLYYLLSTAFKDPGIVPPVSLAKTLFDEWVIPNLSDYQPNKTVQTAHEHRFYKFLTQPHPSRCPLEFDEKENHVVSRFCLSCGLFKAERSTHSSKSNLCIQRYDHYCVWIGHDVGLLNHYEFYKMTFCIVVFIIVCAIFGLLELVESLLLIFKCSRDSETPQLGYCGAALAAYEVWLALAGSIMLLGLFAYFCYSMGQLILFHYRMLQTGSLTKEDLGHKEQNFNYTAMYNRLSRSKNFEAVRENQLQGQSYLREMIQFFRELEESAKTMTLNQMQDKYAAQFCKENISYYAALTENLPPEDSEDSSQTDDRYAHIFTPGWDEREAAKMMEMSARIDHNIAVIPYLAGLAALDTARHFIVNTPQEVEIFKKEHPELLQDRGETSLLLASCCDAKKSSARQPQEQVTRTEKINIPMQEVVVECPVEQYNTQNNQERELEGSSAPVAEHEANSEFEDLKPQYDASTSSDRNGRVPVVDS